MASNLDKRSCHGISLNPTPWLGISACFADMFGLAVLPVLLPFWVDRIAHESRGWVGILTSTSLAAGIFGSVAMSKLAEKTSLKFVLCFTMLSDTILFSVSGFCTSVEAMAAVRAMAGFFHPVAVSLSWVARTSDPKSMPYCMTLAGSAFQMGAFSGSAFGGLFKAEQLRDVCLLSACLPFTVMVWTVCTGNALHSAVPKASATPTEPQKEAELSPQVTTVHAESAMVSEDAQCQGAPSAADIIDCQHVVKPDSVSVHVSTDLEPQSAKGVEEEARAKQIELTLDEASRRKHSILQYTVCCLGQFTTGCAMGHFYAVPALIMKEVHGMQEQSVGIWISLPGLIIGTLQILILPKLLKCYPWRFMAGLYCIGGLFYLALALEAWKKVEALIICTIGSFVGMVMSVNLGNAMVAAVIRDSSLLTGNLFMGIAKSLFQLGWALGGPCGVVLDAFSHFAMYFVLCAVAMLVGIWHLFADKTCWSIVHLRRT